MGKPARSKPKPGPVTGLQPYTWRTATRLTLWVTRHFLTTPVITSLSIATVLGVGIAARGLGTETAVPLAILAGFAFYGAVACLTAAVHLITVLRWARAGWLVGYFTDDASQLVHLGQNQEWVLSEHHARRRNRGYGAELRAVAWPHLTREADRFGAVIRMATRVPGLAARYMREMPGLRVDNQNQGVIQMIRLPA